MNLARYRGILVAVGAIATALVAMNFAILALAGRSPHWLTPDNNPLGWEDIEGAGKKISGVLVERRRTGVHGRLGVILGRSNSREDLDPEILQAAGDSSMRWLSLYGSGASIHYFIDFVDPVVHSDLAPEVVLIAIAPHMLVGTPPVDQREKVQSGSLLHAIRAGNPREAKRELRRLVESVSWIVNEKQLINFAYRRLSHRARVAILKGFGQGVDAIFPPDLHPWRVKLLGYPFHQSQKRLDLLFRMGKQFGWFDPKSYSIDNRQAKALAEIIATLRDHGSRVVIVLLPERSTWRSAVPRAARECLSALLAFHFADQPPPVIDLRDVADDEMFSDYVHLNETGRQYVSTLLAAQLKSTSLLAERR